MILLKSFTDPTLFLNLTSLKHFTSTKTIIMLLTVISPSLLNQNDGKLLLNPIPSNSFFSFSFYKHLSLLFSYWSIPLISCNSIGSYFKYESSDKLYKRAHISISLCTEGGMLNKITATETAVCNFSHFYWCSIHCFLPNRTLYESTAIIYLDSYALKTIQVLHKIQ